MLFSPWGNLHSAYLAMLSFQGEKLQVSSIRSGKNRLGAAFQFGHRGFRRHARSRTGKGRDVEAIRTGRSWAQAKAWTKRRLMLRQRRQGGAVFCPNAD